MNLHYVLLYYHQPQINQYLMLYPTYSLNHFGGIMAHSKKKFFKGVNKENSTGICFQSFYLHISHLIKCLIICEIYY